MDPELTKVTNAANQRRLQLSDVSAFLLLCCAGAAYVPARKATRVHPVEIIRGAS